MPMVIHSPNSSFENRQNGTPEKRLRHWLVLAGCLAASAMCWGLAALVLRAL